MSQEIKCCPNCGCVLEPQSKECPHCFTKIGRNLENFLIARVKLFTLIGIFGALSIYLLNISQNGNSAVILEIGSSFSILIVIILSIICVFDLVRYIKIEEPDYKEFPVSLILQNMKNLPAIILFLVFFVGLISILTIYVLSDKKIVESVMFTLFIIAFSLVLIFIYYIYRYSIVVLIDLITNKYSNKYSDFSVQTGIVVFLGVFSFFLILAAEQIILNQKNGVVPLDVADITFSSVILIIFVTLLIDCLSLMYKKLKGISPNLEKSHIISPPSSVDKIDIGMMPQEISNLSNSSEKETMHSVDIVDNDPKSNKQKSHNLVLQEHKFKLMTSKKSIKKLLTSLIAIIIFLSLAMWYESYLFPNDTKNLIIGIIGGVISGIVIILYQKGIENPE